MNWIVRSYESERGELLIERFIREQDAATVSKIARLLDLLSLHGPALCMPYSRYLGSDLYELRIRARNEVRIFYVCVTEKREVILLHAFKKRSQKLPIKELEVARKRQQGLTRL